MTTLIVKTDSKKYEIHLGHGLVDKISLKSLVGKKEVLLLIDNKVPKPFVKKVENNIKKSSAARIKFLTVNASEKNKNFLYISRIYDFLIKNNFSRDSLIIGIGGGITCDITGFVGSTFLRGIDSYLYQLLCSLKWMQALGGKLE
tara:strand:- start:35 stop:469 length:435 start_codon:yes stop_codon:yes gene_type:complete